MAPAHGVHLTRLLQSLQRVLADRLQHAEPSSMLILLRRYQRLLHQATEVLQHILGSHLIPRADRLGRLKRPSTREHGQPPEKGALARAEQVIAPGKRVAHGALTVGQVTRPVRQQRQQPAPAAPAAPRAARA